MKYVCPDCGAQYESGKFCQECGAKLQEVVPELVCPSCGYKAKTGKFCPECGTKLSEQLVASGIVANKEPAKRTFNERDPRFAKYYDRKGFPRTIPQEERDVAIEYLTPFANQNIPEAKMLLGDIFIGDFNKENKKKGAKLIEDAAQAGDKFAYYYMGIIYFYGLGGTEVNDDEAEKRLLGFYQEYQNGVTAQYLAELYAFSKEKFDYKKALEYAKIAVKDDESKGYHVLGNLYLNGCGVEKNHKLALDNFKMAAAFGVSDAMNQLGWIFNSNESLEANPEQAFYWFNEAAKKGNDGGMCNLGYCYKNGIGVEADIEQAMEWFKKAANLGNEESMCWLGDIFMDNENVKSPEQSFYWFNEAAKKGSPYGMCNLGYCYKEGIGVEADIEQAVEWFKKSAELGHIDAMCGLGNYYQDTLVDFNKAKMWFKKAAELGDAYAQNCLAILYSDEDKDYKQAIIWFKKAMEQDYSFAYRNYAIMLWEGKGIEVNKEKAMEMMQKAISLGHPNAEKELIKWRQSLADNKTATQIESKSAMCANELRIPEGTKILSTLKAPENCSKNWKRQITFVYLPDSLSSVQESLFKDLPNLERIIIPNGQFQKYANMMPSDWYRMYYENGVHALSPDITIPKGELWVYHYGATKIPEERNAIGHVLIPPTCTEISAKAFRNNKEILSVTMSDSVSIIGESAFKGCKKMEFIRLSSKLKQIPKSMLEYCNSLNVIIIPEGTTHIGEAAFANCKILSKIILPSTVNTIDRGGTWGLNPFQYSNSLKQIIVPKGTKNKFQSLLQGFSGNPAQFLEEA